MMAKNQKITFSYRLGRALRQRGYSLRQLARESGVDRAVLRRLKRGQTLPSWSVACRVASALKVTLDSLVGRSVRRLNTRLSADGCIESKVSDE